MSTCTTAAPSARARSAQAAPIPDAAPVTTITRPASRTRCLLRSQLPAKHVGGAPPTMNEASVDRDRLITSSDLLVIYELILTPGIVRRKIVGNTPLPRLARRPSRSQEFRHDGSGSRSTYFPQGARAARRGHAGPRLCDHSVE